MWVPLIEAGEHINEGADYFVDKYLKELMAKDPQIDTLILGCTHYPLLKAKLSRQLSAISPQPIHIISQGALVAESLKDYLARHAEYREQLSQGGSCAYLTTENADRFSQSASTFIGAPVCAEHVGL
jgi:glutamate racemase